MADSPKGGGGESSSLDEDSSDALSPDQPANHDSPLSAVPQLSPSDVLTQNGDVSPTQVLLVTLVISLDSSFGCHHVVNRSTVSSVYHTDTTAATTPTSTTTTSLPGEWLRLTHVFENTKRTDGDLGKLPLLHRSKQGALMFVVSLTHSHMQTFISVMNTFAH